MIYLSPPENFTMEAVNSNSEYMEIVTDLYKIIYKTIGNNPDDQYVPFSVYINITPQIELAIEEITCQDLEILRSMRQSISDIIHGVCVEKNRKNNNISGGGNSGWYCEIVDRSLFLMIDVSGEGNGCCVRINVPCNNDHLAIFDMLVELRSCIENKIRFTQK